MKEYLLVFLLLVVIVGFILQKKMFSKEGFMNPVPTNLQIRFCPFGYTEFQTKEGHTDCCSGDIRENKCSRKAECTLSPPHNGIPTCSEKVRLHLEQKARDVCPPGLNLYFSNTRPNAGGEKGCVAPGNRRADGSAPLDFSQPKCIDYPTEEQNVANLDSCINQKLKETIKCPAFPGKSSSVLPSSVPNPSNPNKNIVIFNCQVMNNNNVFDFCIDDDTYKKRMTAAGGDWATLQQQLGDRLCSRYQGGVIDRKAPEVKIPWRDSPWVNIPGLLKQVSHDDNVVCGVNNTNDIYCKEDLAGSDWKLLPGKLKHVSVSKGKLYGVSGGDSIWYASDYKNPQWRQIPGSLKQVEVDGNTVCGVNYLNDIYCKDDLESSNWRLLPGKLKHVSVSKGKLYGTNLGDAIWYASDYKNPRWRQINGSLKQVDIDGNTVCGVNSGNQIYCKDDLESANWQNVPGGLKYVSVNNKTLYGVNLGDMIYAKI